MKKKLTSFLHVTEQIVEKLFPLWIVVDLVQLKEEEEKKEEVRHVCVSK